MTTVYLIPSVGRTKITITIILQDVYVISSVCETYVILI